MKGISHVVESLLTALPFALCLLITNSLYAQQDAKGCKDSPYVSRFPGSWITGCDEKADDTLTVIVTEKHANKEKKIEGKVSKLKLQYPTGTASKPQVVRNYTTAMRNAGYQNAYDSGDFGDSTWKKGPLWISISIGGGTIDVQSVQEINLTQDVVATAAELGNGIGSTGHAVVPGILFDTGKAVVKDESKPALEQVSKLLSDHPDWKIWVVGHTDAVGQLASNMDLSKQRAAAVAQALETQYHVAPARLGSYGCGPYSPVASNDTDEGRTQNRRVEIVKQ